MLLNIAVLLPLVIGLFSAMAFEVTNVEGYRDHATTADRSSWSYSDTDSGLNEECSEANKCGPASWPKIVAFGTTTNGCAGSSQAPINLNPSTATEDSTLKYPTFSEKNGGCRQWSQFTDDHAVEVNLYDSGNECKNFLVSHEGVEYTLLQLHFHSPAEHTIGFEYFDAEVHLVHKSESGKLLIVGVFLKVRRSPKKVANNEFLNRLWTAAGAAAGSPGNTSDAYLAAAASREVKMTNQTIPIHAYDFLPVSKQYFTYTGNYSGSLTTYPCTEGITWILMKESVAISQQDLTIMRNAVALNPSTVIDSAGDNNRPLQMIGSRTVRSFNEFDNSNKKNRKGKSNYIDPSSS